MADDPNDGSEKDRNAPTVRELKGPSAPKDTVPDVIGVYVPPRPLPEASQHRTMDLKSVRLEDYSRRALTERRLVSPPRSPVPPASERKSSAVWLVPAILIALFVGAWFLLRAPSSPASAEESRTMPSPPAPVIGEAPKPVPAASAPPVVAAPMVVTESPPTAAPEPKIDKKPSAPAPSKAQRSRDAEKKRKDPWLE